VHHVFEVDEETEEDDGDIEVIMHSFFER
jgi:hypothetical protein